MPRHGPRLLGSKCYALHFEHRVPQTASCSFAARRQAGGQGSAGRVAACRPPLLHTAQPGSAIWVPASPPLCIRSPQPRASNKEPRSPQCGRRNPAAHSQVTVAVTGAVTAHSVLLSPWQQSVEAMADPANAPGSGRGGDLGDDASGMAGRDAGEVGTSCTRLCSRAELHSSLPAF